MKRNILFRPGSLLKKRYAAKQAARVVSFLLLSALMVVSAFAPVLVNPFPVSANSSFTRLDNPVQLPSTGIAAGDKLLQFTSAGHVLGFTPDGVTVAAATHMVKVEFLNSRAVVPEADGAASSEEKIAPTLSRVTYRDIWDGVTLVYEAKEGSVVESTYYLNATEEGVPAGSIRLGYNRPVILDEQGNLVIAFENGTMVESAPIAWQEIEGQRKTVTAAYAVYGEREVGFSLGDCVPGTPVVIDPVLTWNTFLGGGDDIGRGIAADGSGNVYVSGSSSYTWSSPKRAYTLSSDAFAAKLDSSGNLIWNTFLGGSGFDSGYGIAVDGNGNVYVVGYSEATWQGGSPPKRAYTLGDDAFAAKLDSSGNLIWNTFLGGSGDDSGYGIAVDGSGNVYVAGWSQATWGSPMRPHEPVDYDAFAAKLDSSGILTWNTFLGGGAWDYCYGIAVDGSGNVYVAGESGATWGSPKRAYTLGLGNAFAVKLDSSGTLTWNTFLGGSGADTGYSIAVDGSGNIYVGGYSQATWGSPVRAYTLLNDAFAAKLDSSGILTWNTFLGSSGNEAGYGIAVDGSGNVYVAGGSTATWGSPWRAYTAGDDAFAARLNSSGTLTWNTFLGGSGGDYSYGIAVDGSGNVYVTGYSFATWGSPVRSYTGSRNAFAAKISQALTVISISPNSGMQGQTLAVTITGTNFTGATVVTFGTGITTNSYTVNSPTQITANIGIAAGAGPGFRDVSVTTLGGAGTLNNGFTVNAAKKKSNDSSSPTVVNPPHVQIKNVNVLSTQVSANQPVTVYASLTNDGDMAGNLTANLKINGQVEQTQSYTVSGQSERAVQFTVYRDTPGMYTVDVNGKTASFTVIGAAESDTPFNNGQLVYILIVLLVILAGAVVLVARRRLTG